MNADVEVFLDRIAKRLGTETGDCIALCDEIERLKQIEERVHGYERKVSGVFSDVFAERARQEAKWGEQNHDPITYLAILTEEVGELAQAALHARFGGPEAGNMRAEAVQVAAVAVAIVECLERGEWSWHG